MDVNILPIDSIDLSVRSVNALHHAGVHTVGDMLGHTEDSLSGIRNLGRKSVEEILKKIEEYKAINENGSFPEKPAEFDIPEDFEAWLTEDTNRQAVTDWLQEKAIRIDALELLSTKAYNLLLFAGYDQLFQIAFLSEEKLLEIPRMDAASADEIAKLTRRYIRDCRDRIFESRSAALSRPESPSIFDMLPSPEYHDSILQYVKANDIDIACFGLSTRARNSLLSSGRFHLSDIIFMTGAELMRLPSMGTATSHEIIAKINEYLTENEVRITAAISGDESAFYDEGYIRRMILDLYEDTGFGGLSWADITEKLNFPKPISQERLKAAIGKLIAEKELEYVDYRCYRVYTKFEDALNSCPDIDERSRDFILRRLQGDTLEEIAREHGMTRERVRQIVKRDVRKVRSQHTLKTGMSFFDEDYYRHLYETYAFEKKDGAEWLGIPAYVWNYLDLTDVKRGTEDLQSALEDVHGLDAGLRLKIKNYLNRNKLFIDGIWVDKKRRDLEEVVVRKFCTEDVSFDKFCSVYNDFLRQEDIPYDEDLYYTETVLRTRKNHLAEARFLLWKQNEQIRYYDIDGRDYTELLEALNLDSYENIELSTAKFMRDYPDILKKYDIRDQYELHNLLRKIVPEGSYHVFRCGRMPDIKFGTFDRDAAILDILIDNAPISMTDLANIISAEYGYDPAVIMGSYLQCVSEYYHQGIYSVDQKQMPQENKAALQAALTEDFYYIDEIRHIYSGLVQGADPEEVNPYTLKTMGFGVYSRYVVQHYASLDAFFTDILTGADVIDITPYRKRFVYVQVFSQILMELKRSLQIIEFEPNQIINIRKLEQAGISKDMIRAFCDSVFDFIADGTYFSAQALKSAGFESALYDLGFSDWFYANLLISDSRFSFGNMFGNLILYKGKQNITIKSFCINRISEHGCIDSYDLMRELTGQYGCKIKDKWDIIYKVQGSEVYYDTILDRLYANKDLYYKELEGEF